MSCTMRATYLHRDTQRPRTQHPVPHAQLRLSLRISGETDFPCIYGCASASAESTCIKRVHSIFRNG